ncbi:hypothetical protein ACHWQZ_G007222 [Mnemiopsis leidyi]
MATRKEQEILHTNLRKWCNLLGYRITDTEMKVITKNSRNAEFWRLIQKLVLPGDDIKLIRSKLAGFQRKQDYNKTKHDVAMLQQDKQDLLAKIAASKARSSQTLASMNTLKTKMQVDSNSKSERLDQLTNNTMREILQKSLTAHCSEVQSKFGENSSALQSATTKRNQLSEGSFSKILVSGSSGNIESECSRAVRGILGQVREYLDAHVSNSHATEDPILKSKVWEAAAKIHSDYSPEEIVAAIKAITADESNTLLGQTESMSIEKDLKNLKFDVVDGNIVSKSDDYDSEKDLESHAIALQNKVSREWIEMLKFRNKSREFAKTLAILNTEVERKVQILPWSSEEKSALSALLKFKLREKELQCKETSIKNEIKRLQDEKDLSTKEKVQTLKTHRSIMDFKKNQEKKQEVIKALVSQTGSLSIALESQTSAIKQLIADKLLPIDDILTPKLEGIKSYPQVLSSTLLSVPLDRLYLSPLTSGSCPVSDLSIYQFEKSSNYHKLLSNTSLPLHLESESFFQYVSDLICSSHKENLAGCVQGSIYKCHQTEVPDSADVFQTLREALHDFDTFTSENVLERIKRSEEKVQGAMKKCPAIKRMINIHSEQPAQYLTPWIKVEDKNLDQIHEKWLVQSSLSP